MADDGFANPTKQVMESKIIPVPFDGTRGGWPSFRKYMHDFLAGIQIPGAHHTFGMLCAILTEAQIQELGVPGEGFRLFAMPRAGDPDSDAYKLAARQSNYRAALCIALTAHVATLVPANIYDLWRTTSVRVVTLNFVEMYTRLKNQYGLMTANELTARCEQLKIPAPPGARYEDIVAAHQNIHQDLSDNGQALAAVFKFSYLCTACHNLGEWVPETVKAYKLEHPLVRNQTFAGINTAFEAAIVNLPSTSTTGSIYGAHAAVAAAAHAAVGATTPSIADLMAEISALKKLISVPPPAVKAAAPPPPAKPTQNAQTPYCWLHGVHRHGGTHGHPSSTCGLASRTPNFDATATIAKRNGGSVRNVNLTQFP